MAARRPPHAKAHAPCPYGKENWADCDLAASRRWGLCKAMVGDRVPKQCSRWAVSGDGWCGQHYTTEKERIAREEHETTRQLQLQQRAEEYIRKQGFEPHDCGGDCPFAHRSARHVCDPLCAYWVDDGGAGESNPGSSVHSPPRKGPHRIG